MKSYNAVVFAGGGSRCLWQVGFWETLSAEQQLEPSVVSGVSAGAAMACLVMAGRGSDGLREFMDMTAANRGNAYPVNLFRKEPVFPHFDMYTDIILKMIDNDAFERIKSGPALRIMLTRAPGFLGARSATFTGLLAYLVEKHTTHPVHPVLALKLGFTPEIVDARECRDPRELADLILSSSCTPPFVPVMRWKNRIALDGGLVDNVPLSAIDGSEREGGALILLTRQYRQERIPVAPHLTYVQPSKEIPVGKWDYTSPQGLKDAYDLGRRDAETFLRSNEQK